MGRALDLVILSPLVRCTGGHTRGHDCVNCGTVNISRPDLAGSNIKEILRLLDKPPLVRI